MGHLDEFIVQALRNRARQGDSVAQMFKEVQRRLGGNDAHIVEILAYFRHSFCLSLNESKPIAELSRSEGRQISDEALLEELVGPEIKKHRNEWDVPVA
ncbi:hypothetical protein [Tuwongella immobilis]|uniref:Uncharacterized protein n=1 Tax=Tuwongella immobilis TaxID=692036 RepID=A0A6C2YS91_9BACT|nr:hypothetical protein [Tuwongella immobilis]VIP03742.1 unnamed protein product [Tuwongella immobilis]VTS04852.1 unnamed protein product [Tuwongella immobilis]